MNSMSFLSTEARTNRAVVGLWVLSIWTWTTAVAMFGVLH